MIQPSELRIGNWVNVVNHHTYYGGGYKQVGEVMYNGVDRDNCDGTAHESEDMEGIPLTPELLEQCGFGKTMSGNYSIHDVDCWLDVSPEGGWDYSVCISANNPAWHPIATVTYLHQLQNLYYSLTGQELTVNLPSNQSV